MYSNYTTTNNINGNIYCGVKDESLLDADRYLGSGLHLQRAIQKYGKENFTRVIDYVWEDDEAAYCLESLIVDQQFLDRDDTYNIALGGDGGDLGSEVNLRRSISMKGHLVSEETRSKLSRYQTGKHYSDEVNAKKSNKGSKNGMWGRTHTEEVKEASRQRNLGTKASEKTKAKMSKTRKGKPTWQKDLKSECPYCGMIGGVFIMKRWHFDNCKDKQK